MFTSTHPDANYTFPVVPVLDLPSTAMRWTDIYSTSTSTRGQTLGWVLHAGGVIEIETDVTTALKFQFHLLVTTGSHAHSLPIMADGGDSLLTRGVEGGLKNATEAVRCVSNKKVNISLCGAIKWPPLTPFFDELRRGTDWVDVTLLRKVVLWAREPWVRKGGEPRCTPASRA